MYLCRAGVDPARRERLSFLRTGPSPDPRKAKDGRRTSKTDLDEASRWFTSAPPRTRAATAASEPGRREGCASSPGRGQRKTTPVSLFGTLPCENICKVFGTHDTGPCSSLHPVQMIRIRITRFYPGSVPPGFTRLHYPDSTTFKNFQGLLLDVLHCCDGDGGVKLAGKRPEKESKLKKRQ